MNTEKKKKKKKERVKKGILDKNKLFTLTIQVTIFDTSYTSIILCFTGAIR